MVHSRCVASPIDVVVVERLLLDSEVTTGTADAAELPLVHPESRARAITLVAAASIKESFLEST